MIGSLLYSKWSLLSESRPTLKDSLPSPEELEKKILFELGLDEDYSGK